MSVLVIAEHDHKKLQPATAHVITAAEYFNQPIYLVILGSQCENIVQQAMCLQGLDQIIQIEDPNLKHPLAENSAVHIVDLLSNATAILAPATTFGKDLLPRVAALLGVSQISNVTKILSKDNLLSKLLQVQ